MFEIGKINKLQIVKEVDFGLYLDGQEHGEILLPKRYVPEKFEVGELLDVFLYFDSEDRIIATTETPYAMVGDFALLKVVSVNPVGAFLDWGLMKDLLVPFREQRKDMREGESYVVYVYLDAESQRIVASAKLDKFLDNLPIHYKEGDQVDLMICNETELGYKAIINKSHWGILYKNEVFQSLQQGQQIKGYIKKIREDEKIDLALLQKGYKKIDDVSQSILQKLRENKGFIAVSDDSPAELIYEIFQISKKNYKKAVGSLYKNRIIEIDNKGIHLLDDTEGE